jgi:hypothetical protein
MPKTRNRNVGIVGTHPWPEDKCHCKKDTNDKSKGNSGQKDYKYERRVKELTSHLLLLTKVLKKEMPEVHKQKGSSTGTDSDSDDALVKNDAFMSQMHHKLETCSLSEQSDDYFQAYTFRRVKAKSNDVSEGHYMAETIIEIKDRLGQLVAAQALLDTGTTKSIVLRHLVRKGHAHTDKGRPTVWNTLSGKFKTTCKALIEFKLPKLSNSKKVTWLCHVDESSNKDQALYNVILGMDIMTKIGLSVDTAEKCITWEHTSTPLKRRGVIQNRYLWHHTYALSVAAPVIQEDEERQSRILDADYSKIDIAQHVSELDHLNSEEKRVLTEMLNQFPVLFGGGLGTLLVRPVYLELQADARPYHSQPFPVLQSCFIQYNKEGN